MRSMVKDVTGKTLTDEYHLKFQYACWTDKLSSPIASNIADQTYTFGVANFALSVPTISQSVAGCTMQFSVWGHFNQFGQQDAWFDYSNCSNCLNYIIKTFNPSTGAIVVENLTGMNGAVDLKPQTILELKVVATSVYSQDAARVIEDSFFLKMRQSPCVDNKLAFDPAASFVYSNHYGTSPVADVLYEIGSGSFFIDPKYST